MKYINYKVNSIIIIIIAIIMFSFLKSKNEINIKADEYMNYLNSNKIRGGCFYIKGDSIRTFKNY